MEEIKNYAISPKENFVYIKIRIATLEQVNNIIDNFCTMPQKEFSMISYVCDCGTRITIDEHNGQCPTCGKDSPHRRKFKTKCPVCETNTFKDKYGHGECENCGWLIDKMSTKQRSRVIYPNLISLNKAKILYKQGKKLEPNLDDFLDGLFMYSEMIFSYNNVEYEVFLRANRNIVLCS
ncbi:MAG: CPCC family cysteine-rich protein [Christensenellales bacterium]